MLSLRPYHNARYAKLRSIIKCVKRTLFKQFEMPTVAKRDERVLHERVISEMRVDSRSGLKNLRPICASKEWEIDILENSGVVAKQYNGNISIKPVVTICIACYLSIALVNNWIASVGQIFLSWNLCYILCDVLKSLVKTNHLHVGALV